MKLAISKYLLFDEPSAYSEKNKSQAPGHSEAISVTTTATSTVLVTVPSDAPTVTLYVLSAPASAGFS